MCGCTDNNLSFGHSGQYIEPCDKIDIDTLNLYTGLLECLHSKSAYNAAGTNENECLAAIDVLTNWKEAKTNNESGCQYYQYWPILQDLIRRIILSGLCS